MEKHTLKEIIKETAYIDHICEGKAYYKICVGLSEYQLELNSNDDEWKATYLYPSFRAINLMRWIRKGIDSNDGTFIQVR